MGKKLKIELTCVGPRDGDTVVIDEGEISASGVVLLPVTEAEAEVFGAVGVPTKVKDEVPRRGWVRTGRISISSNNPLFRPV